MLIMDALTCMEICMFIAIMYLMQLIVSMVEEAFRETGNANVKEYILKNKV